MATLPNWLVPARPAPLYATGIGLGLRAAEQQTAAAQRAQQIAAQAAAQQQEALMQSERLAYQQQLGEQEMALKAQELGISRQELAAREQMNQLKIEEASRLASAQRQYQARVAAGEPPEQVLAEMGPGVGTDAAFAALIREQMRPTKTGLTPGPVQGQPVMGPEGTAVPGLIAVPSATGEGYTVHPVRPQTAGMTEYQRAMLQDRVQRQIDKLYETNPDLAMTAPDKEWSARRKAGFESGQKSIKALEQRIQSLETGAPTPTTGTAKTPMPMPKSKAEAITGQLYNTRMGIMEWDGTKFIKPTTASETYDERE